MSADETNHDDRLAHVPESLRDRVQRDLPLDEVAAWAPYDLNEDGVYVHGWLVLAEDRLGHFLGDDGQWDGQWLKTAPLKKAVLVDGVGMGVLRLLDAEAVVAQWRFTRRHEKAVAEIHRRLEARIDGKEIDDDDGRPTVDAEKKLRCEKCGRVIPAWSEVCPACLSRRKILVRLLGFVKPHKWRAITGALLALAALAMGLGQPYLYKPMINEGLGRAGDPPNWPLFLGCVIILAALIFLGAVARGFQSRLMAGLGSRVARGIRDTVYAHLHKLSLSFYGKRQTGSLVTRVTTDSDRMWDFVAFTVVEASLAFLTIAGVAAIMLWMHWKLALFVLMPVPLMIGLTVFFHRRLHRVFHRIMHRWSQMTSVVADALPGARVIKAFSQEDREVGRFQHKNRQVYDEEMNLITTWTTFGPVMQFCTHLGLIVVWLLGGWWAVQNYHYARAHNGQPMPGGVDVGTLVAFMGYMMMFYRPIHMIAHMDRMLNRAAASAQRIFDILDTPPRVFSKSGARPASGIKGRITLSNVSFSYDGVRQVLKHIDLDIAPGEMIGLAGPSGGGKTTLINLICRFYDVLEGTILIDGVDVRDYDVHDLRRQMGVVLQEPFLFHGTVAENIAYGQPDATRDAIIRTARAANAHDFIVGFPDGYDTLVGERGQTLSGGERQRISIARAILHDPRILILDEATSSVDTQSEKLIQEAIARLVTDRTTIAIAHRLSTLQRAHRLAILDKGRLVEEGSHDELAEREDGLYAKLLRMQTEAKSAVALEG